MDIIDRRRSIRAYTNEPVGMNDLDGIIRAGMKAPSARNQQPWHFIIITDRATLDRIPSIHPHSSMIRQAPAAILVCADHSLEQSEGYWVQDCAAAMENMLLETVSRGLGAVWLGVYPRDERVQGLKKLLNIPEHVTPFSLMPVGHPGEAKPTKDDYRPERIHMNGW